MHADEEVAGASRTWNWVRLAAGMLTIILGIVAFAWPDATLRVVGFLFGLNLLVMGLSRTALMLMTTGTPMPQRILGIVFGVFVGIVGIVCMRNVAGSVALLLVIVAIGWLLDGLAEIFLAVGSGGPGNGWRIAFGLGAVLAAITLLVWPGLGLTAFLFIGSTTLVFVGICLVFLAITGLRTRRA
jgi:uncharacterized membrane protein HdeD (DUF308 family)